MTRCLALCAAFIALLAQPAGALDNKSVTAPVDKQVRPRITAALQKYNRADMQKIADADMNGNTAMMNLAVVMNLKGLALSCNRKRLSEDECDVYVKEFEAFGADNKVSFSELKPWILKIKPHINTPTPMY